MSHPAPRRPATAVTRARATGAALLVALLGAVTVGAAGCSSDEKEPADEQPTVRPTPLSEFDPASVVITRTDFCDFVPAEAVEAAVGPDAETNHQGNGSQIEVDGGMDLSHEYSCEWTGPKGTAQAWVFVPRITEARAKALARSQRTTKGCREIEGDFGDPGVGTVCDRDGGTVASYRGLFVDSWLTCTLERSGAKEKKLVELTGEWCVATAKAAGQAA